MTRFPFLKIFLGLSFFGVCLLAYVFVRAFFLTDVSKAPLENELKRPVYLVSYSDGPAVFRKNQKMLTYSALQWNVNFLFNYKKSFIDPKFIAKHKDVFAQKKGAGYWLWKPWIIQNTLRQVPENAYVIYCDAGFVLQKNPTPLLDLLKTNDVVLFAYENEILSNVTKKNALVKTGCDREACRQSPAFIGGVILLKNTPTTRKFIQKWLTYCEDKDLLLDDGPLTATSSGGGSHRHDQSLLGITYFKNPKGIFVVPTTQDVFKGYFRIHHRHPDEEPLTLITKLDNGIRGWERLVLNSPLFRNLPE